MFVELVLNPRSADSSQARTGHFTGALTTYESSIERLLVNYGSKTVKIGIILTLMVVR